MTCINGKILKCTDCYDRETVLKELNRMQGNSFGKGLLDGVKSSLINGTIAAVTGGIMGGIDAAVNGRDFWTGSFKQYDLPVNYIASTDNNTMFDQYSFPDNATVANGDQYKVYYKPEDGVYGTKNYVSPGKYITKPVDGIATSKYSDMVFKIPNGGRVKVLFGGDVKFTNGYGFYSALKVVNRAGWQNAQYFINMGAYYGNDGWEMLFKLALMIKP